MSSTGKLGSCARNRVAAGCASLANAAESSPNAAIVATTLGGDAGTLTSTGEEYDLIRGGSLSSISDGELAWIHDENEAVAALKDESESVLVNRRRPLTEPRRTASPSTWFQKREEGGVLLVYKMELNVVWWVVVLLGTVVRVWRLDYPGCVVFDEVHFGKFASYYIQRTFFFDVHPPLGKMLFAFVGYLHGSDGSFLFSSIGLEYPPGVPYVVMRGVSASSGSLLVACVYEIMTELGFSHRAAALAALFTVFDNSLVIQSRVVMLDSLVILFTFLSILAYLKFYRHRLHPFSTHWHRALGLTGLFLGLLLGVKYTGFLGLACVGLLAFCDLWQLVGDHTLSWATLFQHGLLRMVYLLGIPAFLNLLLFYLHFLLLTQAGPGNAFVSANFKSTLEGTMDLAHVRRKLSPNATLLRYGSRFIMHSSDLSCWLHSHNHTYPLKYPDGRGSSYQQQVTCYEFRDINNFWTIHKPNWVEEDSPVYNGDIVQLLHLKTRKWLNSHDVAAPLSPSLQEVAGYINYSAQFVPFLQWKLDVSGLEAGEPVFWEQGKMKIRLLHVHSKQALSSTSNRLPAEWGFQQYQVVTDRAVGGRLAWWRVDDLRLPNITSRGGDEAGVGGERNGSKGTREEEEAIRKRVEHRMSMTNTEGRDEAVRGMELSFLEKYFEIQTLMIYAHGNLGDHTFGALPQSWPLMGKTLPYWLDKESNAQVTLLGNPVLWWAGTAAIHAFLCLTSYFLMRRHRQCNDINTKVFEEWYVSGCVLVVGWLVHYLPYFLLSRVLFLHHYLPALPFKFMLLAAMCDHAHLCAHRYLGLAHFLVPIFNCFLAILLLAMIGSYLTFAPFTYGYPALSTEQIMWRLWVETWDLLFHR